MLSIYLLIVVVLGQVTLSWTAFIPLIECSSKTLQPCKSHPSLPSSILCEDIEDTNTFVQVIKCGSQRNMQEVFLERSSLDYVPLVTLDFCGFFFLNLKKVILSNFLKGDLAVGLQQLHLDEVTVRNLWDWRPLATLKKLQRFAVSNMPVNSVDERLVGYLSDKLQSFALTSTNTTSIEHDAFTGFGDLVYLAVQNNGITELKRSMFPSVAKIKFLYFGKNKITYIPKDLFDGMPELEHVGLQSNMLSEIHEVAFRRVWHKLTVLLMDGNPFKCSCKTLWLAKKIKPSILTGNCYSPKTMYGKAINNLTMFDFRC